MSRDHSQNHYGPNASFDGYDSDLASAGILIESLRQQLSAALAACKLKHGALEAAHNGLRWWMDAFPMHVTESDNEEMLNLVKALAIQPDDSALKAWLGEPVGEVESIDIDEDGQPSAWVRLHVELEPGDLLYSPKGLK